MPEWAQQLVQLHSSDGLVRPELELCSFTDLQPITRGDGRHEVFRATHPDGRPRALKEFALAQYDVLLREARLLRALRHPCIVEVEAVVWHGEGHKAYLVLPLCEGGSLQDAMTQGTLDEARVKLFMRQVRRPWRCASHKTHARMRAHARQHTSAGRAGAPKHSSTQTYRILDVTQRAPAAPTHRCCWP